MNDHFAQGVTLDDVLTILATGSLLSSSWEPLVSRALLGTPEDGSAGGHGQDEALLRNASLVRCVRDLALRDKPKDARLSTLPKVALAIRPRMTWGKVAVEVLGRYEPFAVAKPNEALARVFVWVTRHTDTWTPLKLDDGESPGDVFAAGKRARSRSMAADLVADCLLLVDRHVTVWKAEQSRAAQRSLKARLKVISNDAHVSHRIGSSGSGDAPSSSPSLSADVLEDHRGGR